MVYRRCPKYISTYLHSVGLIKRDFETYFYQDKSVMEHFKYPEIFIRSTKKAYLSIVTGLFLDVAKHCGSHSKYALKLMIRRNGMRMNMAYCRNIFATSLRNQGLNQKR
jgi:hypothetical protein